jgi:hypothetical protein
LLIFLSLLLGALAPVIVACGISWSEGETETEVFKEITVVGTPGPGAQLVIEVDYQQPYSANLEVQCDLLDTLKRTPTPLPTEDPAGTPTPTPVRVPAPVSTPVNRVAILLSQTIESNPDGTTTDESTPEAGTLSMDFTAPDEAGRYNIRCYTVADRNNQIFKSLRIE